MVASIIGQNIDKKPWWYWFEESISLFYTETGSPFFRVARMDKDVSSTWVLPAIYDILSHSIIHNQYLS